MGCAVSTVSVVVRESGGLESAGGASVVACAGVEGEGEDESLCECVLLVVDAVVGGAVASLESSSSSAVCA